MATREVRHPKDKEIAVIGLGQMGAGIAWNLRRKGFRILGCDIREEARRPFAAQGIPVTSDVHEAAAKCDTVATCVEGTAAMALARDTLTAIAREGQIFIEHSTITVPAAVEIGSSYLAKGAQYLDCCISGGKVGAEAGKLRLFVGGDRATADYCWPLFEAIAIPEKIVYCGGIGDGQAAKVVQQLTRRWPDMARLENLVFGLRSGLSMDVIMRALDVDPNDARDPYVVLCNEIESGSIAKRDFEFSEWKYFLRQADSRGFRMPILSAMYEYLKNAPRTTRDGALRPEPSLWNELMRDG